MTRWLFLALAVAGTYGIRMRKQDQHPDAFRAIRLYTTGSSPVPPEEQYAAVNYLADYPLYDEVYLSQEQQDSLWHMMKSHDYFIENLTKSCRFQPRYALIISHAEPEADLNILLSPSPCSKALLIRQKEENWVVVPPNSSLETTLNRWAGYY